MVYVRIGDDERELTWEEWEQRVRQGRVPPDAMVRIDAVTGERFVEAGSLEAYLSLRNDAALAWQSRFLAGPAPIVTALLVGVNIRLWWFARVPELRIWLEDRFTNWTAPALEDGETWRTLTMGLLHTELFHLVMNMLWLAYTGWNIERALGRTNLVVLYFASVLGGSLLSMFASPELRSLGASGGVFGLVAACVVFGFLRPELLPARGRRVFGLAMLPYLVVMFWSGLRNDGTDNWSHLGGLLTGGALALALDPEPLQRRVGWNRLWQAGAAAVTGVILFGLTLGGPSVYPLVDHQVARDRLARTRSPTRVPVTSIGDALTYRSLVWSVPAGWRSGVTATGETGFTTPVRGAERGWSVREKRRERPLTTEDLAAEWVEETADNWPSASLGAPEPADVAGFDGLVVRAEVTDGVLVEWRGVVRGMWALEEVWQVETDRQRRLAPLHRRLHRSVVWNDPEALAEARATVDRNPTTRRGRASLARALAEVGEADQALALYLELIAEDPDDVGWWTGMLEVVAWYPDRVADRDALLDDALARQPHPSVALAVVDVLERSGDDLTATGVLELAWVVFPGDRTLRRARDRRDLPIALDTFHNLPRHVAVHPRTGEAIADDEAEAWRERALTLTGARELAADRQAFRDAAGAEAIAAMRGDRPGDAVLPLLLLRDGAVPADPGGAIAGIKEQLTTLERGGAVGWLPPDVAAEAVASRLAQRLP